MTAPDRPSTIGLVESRDYETVRLHVDRVFSASP